MTRLADADARDRIANDFATTLFVEAAAGTGKTTVLVSRIIGLVRSGRTNLQRIVAVTFTEKAAGEMKLRIRKEIEDERKMASRAEQRRLEQALAELELARIGTIHAFCGDLLRERPVEAGIDPTFEVASDDEMSRLIDEAFERWFEATLADPPEGIRRLLRRPAKPNGPREELRRALDELIRHRDFPTAWRRDAFDRKGAADALLAELASVAALARQSSWPEDRLTQNLAEIGRFLDENARLEQVRGRDYDALEPKLRAFRNRRSWNYVGAKRTSFGDVSRDEVLARRDTARKRLDAFLAASGADLAPLLHEALQPAIAVYETLKSQTGRVDFLDLLIKTRDLLRDSPEVRNEIQNRFTHYFIDEFQDTDPLQAEILLLLAAERPETSDWRAARPIAGKLFLVGDPKQAIYRFRRADVAVYEEVKRRLKANGAELVHLTTSFRSLPALQSLVNTAFAPVMKARPDGSQADYVRLDPWRQELGEQPTIIALPVPRPYDRYGRIGNFQINESIPDAIAALIAWLVNESGWTVEENGAAVAIEPRHICILFRRFRSFDADVTRGYVRALEARRLTHVLVGGRSFHDREEIIALRNALVAIEWPDDELRVYATLKGPFFAHGDEALLSFKQSPDGKDDIVRRRLNPLLPVTVEDLAPAAREVAISLDLLRKLHNGRNHRPIAQTLMMLLDAVRAPAGLALWANGEQALANCLRLVDMARRFEAKASSFRAFVERLESDADNGEADEAPVVEEGTEGVRLMTVHRAKGLEFPVVVLADPTCKETRKTASRHVDPTRGLWVESLCGCSPVELLEAAEEELERDRAEAVRVAYVAATRARDLLVVPVCGDMAIEGWIGVLNQALYPADDARAQGEVAPKCPAFGRDSVLDRGEGNPPAIGPVSPGLHRPTRDGPAVVWWDPAVLDLEAEEHASLRYDALLKDSGPAAVESERQYADWKSARAQVITQAATPLMAVKTATALAAEGEGDDAVETEVVDRGDRRRPGGRRFGALVHMLLASIDLDASAESIRSAAATSARVVGATPEEEESAAATVVAVLDHPLLRAASVAAQGGEVRRETPIQMRRADGSLVEGVVDLAFRERSESFDGWIVIDFKTDQELEANLGYYKRQVAIYREAVEAATMLPARAILLAV
jgi:ATP-dependent helicase/nuclease subunit A